MEKEVVIKVPAVYEWNLKELRYACKKHSIKGYTKMSKEELAAEVKKILANMKK